MPENWKWLLLGHPPEFWAAMFMTSAARAVMTGETFKSALVSVPASMAFAYVFTRALLTWFSLPSDPYLFAVGGLVVLMSQPAIRIMISITSLKDLTAAASELIRAWRGK